MNYKKKPLLIGISIAGALLIGVGIFLFIQHRKEQKQKTPAELLLEEHLPEEAATLVKSFGNELDVDIYQRDLTLVKNYAKDSLTEDIEKTKSGIRYAILKKGNGIFPTKGDVLWIHSKGSFLDGTLFFSTYPYKQPLRFTLGVGQVIPAWDEVLDNFDEGAEGTIITPSVLAYAGDAIPKVLPAHSVMVFNIKVVRVFAQSKKEQLKAVGKIALDKKEKHGKIKR